MNSFPRVLAYRQFADTRFQALTSIQEMTLTFVPKLAAIVGVFWITMGFMTETLVRFFQDDLIPLVIGG